jgi:hypothetical protein
MVVMPTVFVIFILNYILVNLKLFLYIDGPYFIYKLFFDNIDYHWLRKFLFVKPQSCNIIR